MTTIKQSHYGNLEIDNREKDTILVWNMQKDDPQVVHIERSKISEFLKQLTLCKKRSTPKKS